MRNSPAALPLTPAERMRTLRRRQRHGVVLLTVEIGDETHADLVALGVLQEGQPARDRRRAEIALARFLGDCARARAADRHALAAAQRKKL